MLQYPNINPVALELGPLVIHWYGVTYLFAFLAGWGLAKYRAGKPGSGWNTEEIGDAVFYIVLGVILGGKIGSLLFYQTDLLFSEPLKALNPFSEYGWRGMSFHGGFLGVLVVSSTDASPMCLGEWCFHMLAQIRGTLIRFTSSLVKALFCFSLSGCSPRGNVRRWQCPAFLCCATAFIASWLSLFANRMPISGLSPSIG